MEICVAEKCTGCAVCENICPAAAISMRADTKGFLRPVVEEQKCVTCCQCAQICPQNNAVDGNMPLSVFAALARNDALRENSSSGGIFSLLAENTIKKGGIVFGAVYDEHLAVQHDAVAHMEALAKLRGSKYVQSQIGQSYKEAKRYLDSGKPVLFSGTPCQIAGLKAFLGKPYAALLTIDILCHGAPSPAVFHMYTNDLQRKYANAVVDIRLRNKKLGWKHFSTQLILSDGKSVNLPQDPFVDGFLRNLYLRESCYQCPYASSKRAGDITLGDFWGYRESAPHFLEDDDRGISLVLVNTSAGKSAFHGIRKRLATVPRTMEDAKRGNKVLSKPFSKPEEAEKFWQHYPECTWEQLCDILKLGKNTVQDSISPEDRAYYAQPFCKRHLRHVLSRYKNAVIRRLRGK